MHQEPGPRSPTSKAPGLAEKAAKLEKKANKIVAFQHKLEEKDSGEGEGVGSGTEGDPADLAKTAVQQSRPKQKKGKGSSGSTKKGSGFGPGKGKSDILSDTAMENAYYTCHDVPHLLQARDFQWAAATKGKKGKKKRKRG